MYARRIGDREFTFDFGAGLIDDNLLIVDRETQSVWSQLAGKAISGPMKDLPLVPLPLVQSTWKYWRSAHADTRVMNVADSDGRPYHYRNRAAERASGRRATGHDVSALGLGLVAGNEAWFFPFDTLEQTTGSFEHVAGDVTVTVYYQANGLTAWAEDAHEGMLPTVLVYRDGWLSFFPDSKIYPPPHE